MSISGKLFIDIIKANDLPSMDVGFGGASDPYIVVKVGGKQVIRTKSVNNNNNPVWNESALLLSYFHIHQRKNNTNIQQIRIST